MAENFSERRRHPRVYKNFILSYTLTGQEEVFEVSQINNISFGGTSFIATRPFESGLELSFKLKTPFLAEEVLFKGVVLDYKEKISEMIYEIRVQFTYVPAVSEEVLKKIEAYAAKEI